MNYMYYLYVLVECTTCIYVLVGCTTYMYSLYDYYMYQLYVLGVCTIYRYQLYVNELVIFSSYVLVLCTS